MQLSETGNTVHRVNFCGGDWWFGGHAKNHRYNGKPDQLRAFYQRLIKKYNITTLLLFGDCRPIHKVARSVAKDQDLTLWVFEEGYTRPGFITCEKDGTNDLSYLPRTPEGLRERARQLKNTKPPVQNTHMTNIMPTRVRMDLAHHLWSLLLKPLYFRFKTHRPYTMGAELRGWATRLRRRISYHNINSALINRYENPDQKFFMVPLQLNSDFQIREHSNYESVLDFIREIIASFARSAPKGALLMFKAHPLDNGMIDYRNYIAMAAMKHGIEGRVDYLEGGDLDQFLKHCEGVALINSTVGYAAIKKAKAIKVMGRALYNMPGLTDQNSIDKFWQHPSPPDLSLINAFLKVTLADSQITGDFFTKSGIKMAVNGSISRIRGEVQFPKKLAVASDPNFHEDPSA